MGGGEGGDLMEPVLGARDLGPESASTISLLGLLFSEPLYPL